jgi:hypothetical protein
MNKHAQANRRNLKPVSRRDNRSFNEHGSIENDYLPSHPENNRLSRYETPSVPMTKPTRLAIIIIRMLNTPPAAQRCLYHSLSPYYDWLEVVQPINRVTYFGSREEVAGCNLREDEQTDKPTPSKKTERQVVPYSHEGED